MPDEIKLADVLALRDESLAAISKVKADFVATIEPHATTLRACEQFISQNLDALGAEQTLARKFSLEDDAALLSSPLDEAAKALAASQKACEQYMHAHLTGKGLQNLKLTTGQMTFLQKGSSCTVFDWETVLDSIVRVVTPPDGVTQEVWDQWLSYIRAQGNWQLLTKKVSSTAVKEIVDAKGQAPDGVKYETFQTVQFRRGSGK